MHGAFSARVATLGSSLFLSFFFLSFSLFLLVLTVCVFAVFVIFSLFFMVLAVTLLNPRHNNNGLNADFGH